MSIKTPVKVIKDASNAAVVMLLDADECVIADYVPAPIADIIAHALNTHAALRASYAELVRTLKLLNDRATAKMNSPIPCSNFERDVMVLSGAALSNAAKVEVPHA